MPEAFQYFFTAWLDPTLLFLIGLGTFIGVYMGAIPGLSITMMVVILVSFTFSWKVDTALALIIGVWTGALYGGSRTAILINIPGNAAAIATMFDGYPLALKGQAGEAIGITTVMSVAGGIFGVLVLLFATPYLAAFALSFQPRDYFLLCLMGILLIGSLSTASMAKGIFSGAFGVLVGTVGMDFVTAQERFTFGVTYLWNGISPIVAIIGLFGIAEVLAQVKDLDVPRMRQSVKRIVPSFDSLRKYWKLGALSSAIGTFVGALPGVGGDVAALISYDVAKRVTKNPEVPFGQGAKEGLIAPEAANNAAMGGSLIPMLSLGIPGDAVTAVVIGGLYVHGLNPGPLLMVENPYIFLFFVGSCILANLFLLVFGLTGIRIFTKIVECPRGILYPLILLFSVVGAFALNNSGADVLWALGFGVLGYFMRNNGYPIAPMVLGVVLSALLDQNWRRSLLAEQDSIPRFLGELFSSPLSVALLVITAAMILSQTVYGRLASSPPQPARSQ